MSAKGLYLYITPFFPSPSTWRGGFCYDAVKALVKDGRYDVIVMTASGKDGDYVYGGVRVFHIPRIRLGDSEYFESLLDGVNNRLFLGKLAKIGMSASQVAVCHVHDALHYVSYALAVKSVNHRCVTLVHHHWSGRSAISFGRFGCLPLIGEMQFMRRRRLLERIDAHVFCSEESRRQFGRNVRYAGKDVSSEPMQQQLKLRIPFRDIRYRDSYVLYNGVDRSVFFPCRKVHEGFVIGCVGNFNPGKCQIELIRAFALVATKVPTAKIRFVGSGPELSACKSLSDQLGLSRRIEFLPEVNHSELSEFYRGLDLFVLPSVNEGFCCVFVEANACGVPVIGTKVVSLSEVLPRGVNSDWLLMPHDIGALADKIYQCTRGVKPQTFSIDLDINVLTRKFLDWVDSKVKELK